MGERPAVRKSYVLLQTLRVEEGTEDIDWRLEDADGEGEGNELGMSCHCFLYFSSAGVCVS